MNNYCKCTGDNAYCGECISSRPGYNPCYTQERNFPKYRYDNKGNKILFGLGEYPVALNTNYTRIAKSKITDNDCINKIQKIIDKGDINTIRKIRVFLKKHSG